MTRSPDWHVLAAMPTCRAEAQLLPSRTLLLQRIFTKPTGEEWDCEGLRLTWPLPWRAQGPGFQRSRCLLRSLEKLEAL